MILIYLEKLQLFFLSIFWRSANSEHPSYNRVFIPEPWNDERRKHILEKRHVPFNLATVKIYYLKDKRKNGVLTDKTLTKIIMTPFHRWLNNLISFFVIMEGFLVEFSTPGIGFKERRVEVVLNPKQNILVCPFIHPFDIPEFRKVIVTGMCKGFETKTSTTIESSAMAGLEFLRKRGSQGKQEDFERHLDAVHDTSPPVDDL